MYFYNFLFGKLGNVLIPIALFYVSLHNHVEMVISLPLQQGSCPLDKLTITIII